MAETAENANAEDQSMEEILQSIRRIITEDEAEEGAETAETAAEAEPEDDSDVLELTEIFEDDAPADAPAEEPAETESDILENIDAMIVEAGGEAEPPQAPEMPPQQQYEPAAAVTDVAEIPQASADTLVSDVTAASAAAMLSRVKQQEAPTPIANGAALPPFASGATMESLVMETMRPMLKAWLEVHLPEIVEKVVEREVRRISEQ